MKGDDKPVDGMGYSISYSFKESHIGPKKKYKSNITFPGFLLEYLILEHGVKPRVKQRNTLCLFNIAKWKNYFF